MLLLTRRREYGEPLRRRALVPTIQGLLRRSATTNALDAILSLGRSNRLPLHVARRIKAAAGERHDVIDHIARTAVGIASLPRECVPGRIAALNPPLLVPRRLSRGRGARPFLVLFLGLLGGCRLVFLLFSLVRSDVGAILLGVPLDMSGPSATLTRGQCGWPR